MPPTLPAEWQFRGTAEENKVPDGHSVRELLPNGSIRIDLNPAFFEREAILRAAYWLTRDCFISISPADTDATISVTLRLKRAPAPTLQDPRPVLVEEIADQFENSILDFQLRLTIERETSTVRELILAKAFAEAGVLEDAPPGSPLDSVAEQETVPSPGNPLKILSQ
jgi:His-Xaa-Ser system protein HxsD